MSSMPIAFMSYASFDDRNNDKYVSKLCSLLSNEVEGQSGDPFPIFQDRTDIKWGENWKNCIEESLDNVAFLIPIISPKYFKSRHCKEELEQFLRREKKLGRTDMILPIYFIKSPLMDNEKARDADTLAQAINNHHFVDWRDHRFVSLDDSAIRMHVAALAESIVDALERARSIKEGRGNSDYFYAPHNFTDGKEQQPVARHLSINLEPPGPRGLLELALAKKQSGDYEGAKHLFADIISSGIIWGRHIELFVDMLYFSISLFDKLEEWKEIDNLEQYVFKAGFAAIKPVTTQETYQTIMTAYQASMALAMLRQSRLEEARLRIEKVVGSPPVDTTNAAAQILYANALVTRALIRHATWACEAGKVQLIRDALADLARAETLYQEYAAMGSLEEFHHLGRFYGIRAFLNLAQATTPNQRKVVIDTVLDDAERAHMGENRTMYGRVAGKYCEAFCRMQAGLLQTGKKQGCAHYLQSLKLLKEAEEALPAAARLGRVKVTGLANLIAQCMAGLEIDKDGIAAAYETARKEFRSRGHEFLDTIESQAWLSTPLN